MRSPGPIGSCSPVCLLGALLCVCCVLGHLAPVHRWARSVCGVGCAVGVLCHLAPVHRCARSVCCAVGCVCGAACAGRRCGAHTQSIWTAAVRSRQGLGTLRARTCPSGRRLFVAGRGWVPSRCALIYPDDGCLVAGRGWVRCRARTPPSERQLFVAGRGWVYSGRALVHLDGGWCWLAPVLVPCFLACCVRSLGLRHPAAVVAYHLSVCLCLWPAACLSGVPPGPAWCAAPRPVRSLSLLLAAFPKPWCLSTTRGLASPDLLGGCDGHAEAGREWGSLCLLLAPAEAGALSSLRVVPVRGPATGLSPAGPSGVHLVLRALRWLPCADPVTDASGFPCRPWFDGGLSRCTGAVSCGRRHLALRVGGPHARVPCVCACARPSWPGRAGWPPGRVLVRLTFSFGRFVLLLCSAPSRPGLRLSSSFVSVPFLSPFFCCVVPFLRLRCLLLVLNRINLFWG